MLLAEFQVGQVVWSMLWLVLVFMWIWLVISVFGDIVRSTDLSGGMKALWSIFIIFLPYLGVFVYLIARGDAMGERERDRARAAEASFRDYIADAAGHRAGPADELARLAEMHANGTLDDGEYAKAKAKVLE